MTKPLITTAEINAMPCGCPPTAKPSERCTKNGWIRCVERERAYKRLWKERKAS